MDFLKKIVSNVSLFYQESQEKVFFGFKKIKKKLYFHAKKKIASVKKYFFEKKFYYKSINEKNLLRKITPKEQAKNSLLREINKSVLPGWISFSEIFLVVSLCILIILISLFNLPTYSFNIDLNNLIDIHTGVGAALLGLIFFLTPIALNKDAVREYKSYVVFKETSIFTLFLFEIFTFSIMFFISEKYLWLVIIPILIISIITVTSLYKAIDLFLSQYSLNRKQKELFFKDLRLFFLKQLDFDLKKRITFNYLNSKFKKIPELIMLNPFGPRDESKYIKNKIETVGLIKDMKLGVLNKLIYTLANKKKVDIYAREIESIPDGSYQMNSVVVISGSVNYKTSYYNQTLSYLSNEKDFSDSEKALIVKQLEKVFVISKDNNLESQARLRLLKLKASCIESIKKMQEQELDSYLSFYVSLISEYGELMKIYGGGFSQEQALSERSSFFLSERLNSISWIVEDIRDLFSFVLETKNKKIISSVIYLPIRIMRESIKIKDHYIFQEFLRFYQTLYFKSIKARKDNSDIGNYLFDRSWRYIKEFVEFYLKPEEIELEDIRGYSNYILKIFQGLLKSAIDNKDTEGFDVFIKQLNSLFRFLEREYRYEEGEYHDLYIELNKKKEQIFFGITSWLLFLVRKNKFDEVYMEMYKNAENNLSNDMEEFSQLFSDLHSFEVQDYWGWDNWELSLYSDEEAHVINIHSKIELLYLVHSLKILNRLGNKNVSSFNIESTRNLSNLHHSSSSLMMKIKDMEKSKDTWNDIVNDEEINQISLLNELLLKIKEDQDVKDTDQKIQTSISESVVQDFKNNYIQNYKDSYSISRLFKKYNSFINKSSIFDESIDPIGINTMFDKASFFSKETQWHIHYSGIDDAFDFGRKMAYGENNIIFKEFRDLAVETDIDFFDEIISENSEKSLVILSLNNAQWLYFESGKENYIPNWSLDYPEKFKIKGVEGVFLQGEKYIPVYNFFVPDNQESEIYVLDSSCLGKFIQLHPLSNQTRELKDVFYVDVIELNDNSEEFKKILEENPKWLQEITDIEERKRHLRERVVIKVFEKFKFEKPKNFFGHVFKVDKGRSK